DLLFGDADARDLTSARRRHVLRDLAPAAADVEYALAWRQAEAAADCLHLSELRRVEIVAILVVGAAVILVLAEEGGEELVVGVVVTRRVFTECAWLRIHEPCEGLERDPTRQHPRFVLDPAVD